MQEHQRVVIARRQNPYLSTPCLRKSKIPVCLIPRAKEMPLADGTAYRPIRHVISGLVNPDRPIAALSLARFTCIPEGCYSGMSHYKMSACRRMGSDTDKERGWEYHNHDVGDG